MDLYQAGYFRFGKQEIGSGWDIVAPSDGMSNFAIDGFKGIASSLINLQKTVEMPVETEGLFQYEYDKRKFIYFIHVNYAAHGKDGRGVAYIHAYCFSLKEYYELCIQPEMLFGIKPGTFDMEYRSGIKAYPVEHSFPYEKIDYNRLMDKYNISNVQYKNLVLGAICAIEKYSNPMCIKCSTSLDHYLEIYKDIMYLVMSGLPYHLRQKALSFSYKGIKGTDTNIYFSDVIEGNNYFDLDSGEAFCDFSMLGKYYFTRIYNTPIYYNNENRNRAFQNIADFINASYKNPLKNADCEMIEAGFQEKIKKNEDGGIPPEIVPGLFDTLLKYDITNSDEVAEYIADLLETAYNNNLGITKKVPIEKIKGLYGKFTLERLHKQIAYVFIHVVLGCKKNGRTEKGFDILWNLKKENLPLYNLVCAYLKEINYEFYNNYFINKVLPSEIINLDKAEEYLTNNIKNISVDICQAFLKQVKNIIDKEIKEATSFTQMSGVVKNVNRVADKFSRFDGLKDIFYYSCYVLWSNFNIEWFKIKDLDSYKSCQVQKIAGGFEGKPVPNAEKVNWLMSMAEDVLQFSQITKLSKFIFTNDRFDNKEFKNRVLQELKKRFNTGIKRKTEYRDMEISLLLNYNIKKKQFALADWINGIGEDREIYENLMEEFVQASHLLQKDEIKRIVIQSAENTVKNKREAKYYSLGSNGRKALSRLQSCLSGNANASRDTGQLFYYTLHRGIIGLFAIFTFIICNLSLWRYGSRESYMPLVLAAVFIVPLFILVSYTLYKAGNNKTAVLFKSLGIKTGNNILAYICVVVIFLLMAIIICNTSVFLVKAICSMVFLDMAAASVFLYGITLKE
ncbi:MAG: hypothetical protein K1W24_00125 [Lachnospiraceae bacterium]